MCIIIIKPADVSKNTLTRETLYNCWTSNPHGAGIMFAYRGRMIVWKGLMTFDKFMEAWGLVPEHSVAVAHFRIGTHAKNDEANTHPFWIIQGELAVAHNGILPIKAREKDNLSDTATFVEDVLKALPQGWLQNPATLHLIDGYIGHSNKLVFLDRQGRVTVLNEQAGVTEGGCWYSNSSYKRVLYTFDTTPKGLITGGGALLRERWKGKGKAKDKPKDGNKAAARNIIESARSRHKNDDGEVARELGITLEEVRELMVGQEDESAIRALEVQVERDNIESHKD